MTDKKQPNYINAKRRGFLQGATVAGGAVVGGVATGVESSGFPVAEAAPIQPEKEHKGYEENDYVRRYYARARY